MKGSISLQSEKKGTWQIRIDCGKGPGGKRARFVETFQGDHKAAEVRLREKLHEMDEGLPIRTSKERLADFLGMWLEIYTKTNCSQRTYEGYKWYIGRYIVPQVGNISLNKLAPQDIQGLYSKMLQDGLSPRTVLHCHRILRQALSHCIKWEMIARNPADAVDPPRPRQKEMKALNPAQVQVFLTAASTSPYRHVFYLAVYSGLRLGELLGLRWYDLDIERRTLSVNRSIARISGQGLTVTQPKTAKSRRLISLPESTVSILSGIRGQQRDLVESEGEQWDNSAYIFPGQSGGPMSPGTVSHAFLKIIRQSGLPRLRFHDLRHTHATIMLKAGVHPKIVSERLGHASVSVTLDIYSHVIPGLQEQAVDMFDRAMQISADIGTQMGSCHEICHENGLLGLK